jgi:hypothetical protein
MSKIMSLKCHPQPRGTAGNRATRETTTPNDFRDERTQAHTRRHPIGQITRAGSVGVRGSSPLSSTCVTSKLGVFFLVGPVGLVLCE